VAKRTGKPSAGDALVGLSGFLGSLGILVERLGELAEKGEELRKSGEIRDASGKLRGVYGFNVRFGIGQEGFKIEPFGNLHRDQQTGKAVVSDVREPVVDVFDEQDHVLVVAEMPGVSKKDIHLELHDDILTIVAERADKKYRKEVLLPASFCAEKLSYRCPNGVLEVKILK